MRRAGDVDRLQRLVAADAVIVMDDEVARRQRCGLGDELVEAAPSPRGAGEPVAEDVLLAEQHEVVGSKTLLDRQHGEPDHRTRQCFELPTIGDAAEIGNAALAQHGQETVGRARAECGDRGLAAGFSLGFEVVADRLEEHNVRVGALGREATRRAGAGIEGITVALIRRERRQLHDGPAMQCGLPLAAVEVELLGPDRAIDRRTGARRGGDVVARRIGIADRLEPVAAHLLRLVIERDPGSRQIVE